MNAWVPVSFVVLLLLLVVAVLSSIDNGTALGFAARSNDGGAFP
jgi:hypothetical protein